MLPGGSKDVLVVVGLVELKEERSGDLGAYVLSSDAILTNGRVGREIGWLKKGLLPNLIDGLYEKAPMKSPRFKCGFGSRKKRRRSSGKCKSSNSIVNYVLRAH